MLPCPKRKALTKFPFSSDVAKTLGTGKNPSGDLVQGSDYGGLPNGESTLHMIHLTALLSS